MRLHKWLSMVGFCSLRKGEELIAQGQVLIDGQVAKIGQDIDEANAEVTVNGKIVSKVLPDKLYFMLYKPVGTVCSTVRDNNQPCLNDLAAIKNVKTKLSPVGRLDCFSEGLLLMTNDGQFCNKMMHPRYKVTKYYRVESNVSLPPSAERELGHGLMLEDGLVSAKVIKVNGTSTPQYDITIAIGRNRIVRRIFEHYGLQVRRLTRLGVGELRLDPRLRPGEMRPLTEREFLHLNQDRSDLI